MPVYVVNMGKGGMGNDNGPELPDSQNKKNPSLHPGLVTTAISTASELTSIIPFPETDEQKSDLLQKVKENNNRRTMWNDIKDWFTSTANAPQIANPQPWASLQPQSSSYPAVPPSLKGEIRVIVEGDARVKSVKMDQPGVTLSAQSGVSNVEQN